MELPRLIQDLAIILSVAAIVTLLFRRLRLPLIIGYVGAGFLAGNFVLRGGVLDLENIKTWANLGVIFLMFSLGLDFSFRKLLRLGPTVLVVGVAEILMMLLLGQSFAKFLGWPNIDGLFLGAMIAISSTSIVIKALTDGKLMGKKFADIVCGLLIVEDLAAIVILVALSAFGREASIDPWMLGRSIMQLSIVIGAWLILGMLFVPRFFKAAQKVGNDETLLVAAVALCLLLVLVADEFRYSAALGAFLSGSLLAETQSGPRVTQLIKPLKELFGAVFFIAVGLEISPELLGENLPLGLLVAVLVIVGKGLAISATALATGQSLLNSTRIALAMGQVGEFSFVIATLGLSIGAMSPRLYPIIVCASVITSITTPLMIRYADTIANRARGFFSPKIVESHLRYQSFISDQLAKPDVQQQLSQTLIRWSLNAVVIVVLMTTGSFYLPSRLAKWIPPGYEGFAALALATMFALPFIWAMVTAAPPRLRLIALFATFAVYSVLAQKYLQSAWAIGITAGAVLTALIVLRTRLAGLYGWYESHFLRGFYARSPLDILSQETSEFDVEAHSPLCGKSLNELQLTARFDLIVVAIERAGQLLVPPDPNRPIFPTDKLLLYGKESAYDQFRTAYSTHEGDREAGEIADLSTLAIPAPQALVGKSIQSAAFRRNFQCLILSIQRGTTTIRQPKGDLILEADDRMLVVGPRASVQKLLKEYA